MNNADLLPHEARRLAVLAIITDHIGKILPTSRNIAYTLGCTTAQVDHSLRMLSREGVIDCQGNGNGRIVIVFGKGATIPRHAGKEVAAYRPPAPEPVRVESFSCPRCGARSCQRHSAAVLVTRAVPAWRVCA